MKLGGVLPGFHFKCCILDDQLHSPSFGPVVLPAQDLKSKKKMCTDQLEHA